MKDFDVEPLKCFYVFVRGWVCAFEALVATLTLSTFHSKSQFSAIQNRQEQEKKHIILITVSTFLTLVANPYIFRGRGEANP